MGIVHSDFQYATLHTRNIVTNFYKILAKTYLRTPNYTNTTVLALNCSVCVIDKLYLT